MDDLGTYQQGQEMSLAVQCVDAIGPAVPDGPPVATVYGPDGAVAARLLLAADLQGSVRGAFRRPLPLDSGFDAGLYAVLYQWTAADVQMSRAGTFRVQPGGGADGAVIALHPARRQEAAYLIRLTDAGQIARGRNPR